MTTDPKRQFATDVVRKLQDAGYTALWAGGCVRDILLGLEPKDYDVATNCLPEDVRALFGHRRTQAVGASFGVILVRGPKGAAQVEVATFRTEGSYLDGRRPSSVEFSTPEEDAQRRDFTINGMFYDPVEQQVYDYVGGERDLSAGVIRAIGIPHERMREDKLRMLRAIRFAATLDFELDEQTAAAIREMAGEIVVISAERITQELRLMLVDAHRMRAATLCRDVGLLQRIIPELHPILGEGADSPASDEWDITLHMLQLLQQPSFGLACAVLLSGIVPSESHTAPPIESDVDTSATAARICRRLRMSNNETDHITWLLAHRHALDEAPQLPLSRLKRLIVQPGFRDLLALVRVERLARNLDLQSVIFVEEYVRRTPAEEIDPPELLGGHDLIALGLSPGPEFREILKAVRDAQLNGDISSKAEAIALAERMQDKGR